MIRHDVVVRHGDRILRAVTDYALTYDLRHGWPTATVVVATPVGAAEIVREMRDGRPVTITVDDQLVATLRVQRAQAERGPQGTRVRLDLLGATSVLEATPMPLAWRPGSRTLQDAVRDICDDVGVAVTVERTAAQRALGRRRTRAARGATVVGQTVETSGGAAPAAATAEERRRTTTWVDDRESRPRPGETRWSWVRRMAADAAVWAWEQPDGVLRLGLPVPASAAPAGLYDATATSLTEGAVLRIVVEQALGGTPHAVRVVGRLRRRGEAAVDETVRDALSDVWPDSILTEAPDLRGADEARRRAMAMLASASLGARTVTVECVGNGPPTAVAWPDQMYTVHAPDLGVDLDRLLCVAVSWTYTEIGGTQMRATLVDREAFALAAGET